MSCSAQKNKCGGLVPVDPESPKIQKLSAWAVNEYNKQHGKCLKFEKALKAEQQVVAGMMYYLVLEVGNGGLLDKCEAKVFEQEWTGTLKLEEFKFLIQENERIAVCN